MQLSPYGVCKWRTESSRVLWDSGLRRRKKLSQLLFYFTLFYFIFVELALSRTHKNLERRLQKKRIYNWCIPSVWKEEYTRSSPVVCVLHLEWKTFPWRDTLQRISEGRPPESRRLLLQRTNSCTDLTSSSTVILHLRCVYCIWLDFRERRNYCRFCASRCKSPSDMCVYVRVFSPLNCDVDSVLSSRVMPTVI